MKKIVALIGGAFIISFLLGIIYQYNLRDIETDNNEISIQKVNINEDVNHNNVIDKTNEVVIDDWRITLVNHENQLPENFEIELANIDSTRQFDKRAISELMTMMKDAKSQGVSDMWVQSAYRSIGYQQGLFDEKVDKYLATRKNKRRSRKFNIANNK